MLELLNINGAKVNVFSLNKTICSKLV